MMSNTLTDKQVERLIKLGKDLAFCLQCNANGDNFPCRTDRLEAVKLMQEYLEIHDYTIVHTSKALSDINLIERNNHSHYVVGE
jgi:hypothetical protein